MRFRPHIILTALFATALLMAGCKTDGKLRTKEDVESLVRQNVTVGASRDSVIAVLDANHIEHSGKRDPRSILAMVRPADDGAIVRRAFQIKFDFGQDDRLTKYEVIEKFTGP